MLYSCKNMWTFHLKRYRIIDCRVLLFLIVLGCEWWYTCTLFKVSYKI
nr:MAG TPA: hypothetical protein [Caudoviricetes sp.]